jgi:hypothetical protein
VPVRNPDFTGREELIQRLHDMLQGRAETAAVTVALRGPRGVGKTQLAVEFVYRYAADYDLVWWIPAASPNSIRKALAELADALAIPRHPDVLTRVATALGAVGDGPHARKLLIYDGAGSPAELAGLLPDGVATQVLVTSRSTAWTQRTPTLEVPPDDVQRDQLVICYSHADRTVLDQIRIHLAALRRISHIRSWDDTQIRPGSKWREEIRQALATARVALLLISPEFLASDFVMDEEVPTLLKAAQEEGVVILCLIVRPSLFDNFDALSQFQTVNAPDRPLSSLSRYQREKALVALAKTIDKALAD